MTEQMPAVLARLARETSAARRTRGNFPQAMMPRPIERLERWGWRALEIKAFYRLALAAYLRDKLAQYMVPIESEGPGMVPLQQVLNCSADAVQKTGNSTSLRSIGRHRSSKPERVRQRGLPRLGAVILQLLLSEEELADQLDDLQERYQGKLSKYGISVARAYYYRRVLVSIWPNAKALAMRIWRWLVGIGVVAFIEELLRRRG